jgi:hypothetical protein
MADTAAHLVDRVFPEVRVRQWVLSLPFALGYHLAYDSSLVRDVLQIFVRTVFASIRRRARIPASNRQARCGAVAFIQRFSDALNLDPHFHTLALDGIYVVDGKGELLFRHAPPPGDAEVAHVADRVRHRVERLMERRGLGPQTDPDEADSLRRDEPFLKVNDDVPSEGAALPSGRCCASVSGFSVHAGVCVPARDRMRLERLARYAGRPPLATERLSLLPDGRLLYRLKRRWRDGTTHVIYEPLELVERLAALVPPPRFNITRYFGVLAPAATFRPQIIPRDKDSSPPMHPGCQSGVETPKTDSGKARKKRGRQRRNYSWAQLMTRVFELDVLACPRCGARMRILCAINPPDAIRKILAYLGLPAPNPPIAPAMPDGDAPVSW